MMKKRVFSGARPTGRQHIGNYLGAIQNYVKLQDEYECFYCVVDLHALTTLQGPEAVGQIQQNILEMVLDWLAAGLDPNRSTMFVQSHVPEVTELHLLLSMTTPMGWLMRVPTFKEKVKIQPDNVNYGLLGYPVLMTSDIVLYKAEVIPVGEDQVAHLELAREIVRRFNSLYGPTFPEPQPKLTHAPMVVGLDGVQKMSKQLNNHVELAATPEETAQRIMGAFTDPARKRRNDPGHPEVCNIYRLHEAFDPVRAREIEPQCREAGIGCVECKRMVAGEINEALAPLRDRRNELAKRPDFVRDILAQGAGRAKGVARDTMMEVRDRMGLLGKPG
jgi:tryptophanyl-tRNA synthetase